MPDIVQQPLVSIIMPSFNREGLIGASIASVQAQSLPAWELLIIDDGSADGTVGVAAGYAAADSRIRVMQRTTQPKGPSTCRNLGIAAARAPHCLFLDSDDLLASHCLAGRIAAAQAEPRVALHVFQMQFFYEWPGDTNRLFFFADRADALGSSLVQGSPWGITCPLWRIDVLRGLEGFDESLPSWEDWDLHIRAFAFGHTYRIHDAVDCYCRQGQVSLTSQHQSLAHVRRRTALYLKIARVLRDQGLPLTYLNQLAGKCLTQCGELHELGDIAAAQQAWTAFAQAGILSGWKSVVGSVYLTLRRTVARDGSSLRARILRKSMSLMAPRFLIWSY